MLRDPDVLVRVRRSGLVDRTSGLGPHDHVCWRYTAPDELRERARDFLADGLARGLQVWYVAPGAAADLARDLRGVDALDTGLRTGAARVVSLDATYPMGAVVEPDAQVRAYAEATEAAIAAGFAGLRVAADCTPLVGTPRQLAAFARYEHRIDRYMADQPFSALCAYSTAEVDDAAFAQLACMHPGANSDLPGFRLHGAGGRSTALGGELDLGNEELFALALERAQLRPHDGLLELDATGLVFLDHRALTRLSEHAAALGATAVLRTSWPGAAKLVDLLDLTNIYVECAP
ncbi:MEDS domain-containing protein [Saccharothrix sp. S26]|uniref:MEDS domain-containing protein n=1 Tax=Saccharothrix sp. S26 TaxID=2907215 RepID=UPI001F26C019|nr:MEDS domain-containing protein [Saccharothrix sp. S26]MCE6996284.1 MEDS domain-containing protein [Saccharothrix sp. S26]